MASSGEIATERAIPVADQKNRGLWERDWLIRHASIDLQFSRVCAGAVTQKRPNYVIIDQPISGFCVLSSKESLNLGGRWPVDDKWEERGEEHISYDVHHLCQTDLKCSGFNLVWATWNNTFPSCRMLLAVQSRSMLAESKTPLDSGFRIQLPDSRSFSVELGFWIPVITGILDSYTCWIPGSTCKNYPDSLIWCDSVGFPLNLDTLPCS